MARRYVAQETAVQRSCFLRRERRSQPGFDLPGTRHFRHDGERAFATRARILLVRIEDAPRLFHNLN